MKQYRDAAGHASSVCGDALHGTLRCLVGECSSTICMHWLCYVLYLHGMGLAIDIVQECLNVRFSAIDEHVWLCSEMMLQNAFP